MNDEVFQRLLARLKQQLADFDAIKDPEQQQLKNLDGVTLRYGELRMLLAEVEHRRHLA